MNSTKGIRWSVEQVHKGVLDVKTGLGLNRMPTNEECVFYTNSNALSGAIRRYCGGFFTLAKTLGLSIKSSETATGKYYENIVAERLRSLGCEVRHTPQNYPYDLLVNGCVKVDVKYSSVQHRNSHPGYKFCLRKPISTCDVFILVTMNDASEDIRNYYIIPAVDLNGKLSIGIGINDSEYIKYINRWDIIAGYSYFMKASSLKKGDHL